MQFFTILELIVTGIVTLYLIQSYSSKDIPLYVKTLCFISWFLSFSTLILVPLDVYYTLSATEDGTKPGEEEMKNSRLVFDESYMGMVSIWKVVYWTSFIFTWLLLPFLQEYVDAGDFTVKEKIKRSLKINLIIYGVMAAFGVIFVFYLEVSGRIGEEGLVHFFITFANCFGIVLIILCLSYGLVAIPKRYFQKTRQNLNLKAHQFQAALIDEQRNKILFRVQDLIKDIHILLARDDIEHVDKQTLHKILAKAPPAIVREVHQMCLITNLPSSGEYDNLTKSTMAILNKRMKKRVNELKRIDNRWEITQKQAAYLEDVIQSKTPSQWRSKSSYKPSEYPQAECVTSALEWTWNRYLSRVFFFFVGFILLGFSLVVFFAEILNFIDFHFHNLESWIQSGGGAVAKSQFLCLLPLFYLSLCVYSALFNMKLAGRFGLYKHKHTDAASLVFFSLNFSRVSAPLVLNFLQMLKIKDTAFHKVMGDVNFAYSFMEYFPMLLIVLILCNVFDVYGRVLGYFGLGRFRFNDEATNERIEEGKNLLQRARHRTTTRFPRSRSTPERMDTSAGRQKDKGSDKENENDKEESITVPESDMSGEKELPQKGYEIQTVRRYEKTSKSLQDL